VGNYTYLEWTDFDGQRLELYISPFTLYFAALSKIIVSLFFLKQARFALKIFKPILLEYKQAEEGAS